jgi:endoglucanase
MPRTSPSPNAPSSHPRGVARPPAAKWKTAWAAAFPARASLIFVGAGLTATWWAAACFTASPPADGGGSTSPALRGCVVGGASAPAVAPGGYYTSGATVCSASGTPHIFHGVDRPSLEWDPQGEFNGGEGIPASDFQAMASWHANIVRIAMNQDFWLSEAALYQPDYEDTVDRAVHDAEAAGLDVILDLHWSDAGNIDVTETGTTRGAQQNSSLFSDQQQMADLNSKEFWSEVATKYAGDGHVLFELYNEPNSIPWDVWINGGMVATSGPSGSVATFQAVGMQDLYDTVRQTGAKNLVIAGGLNWAFDLSGVAQNPIQGFNLMYATHPYDTSNRPPSVWPSSFGYLAEGDIAPVIATEFGDGSSGCTGAWDTELIEYAAQYNISWTAWAWWAGGCSFPALLSDWSYTPTSTDDPTVPGQGQVVKAALALDPPVTPPVADAGSEAGADGEADAILEGGADAGARPGNDAAGDAGTDATLEAGADAAEGGPGDSAASPVLDGADESAVPDEAAASQ